MSKVRFIADLHLGHVSMSIKRGFSSVDEHDEYIITKWNSVVHKRDVTYILGDVTMEKAEYDVLNRLNGRKYVVLGNHDKLSHARKLLEYVDSVAGMVKYKGIMLTHCPIHPMEMDYRFNKNIHGHIHEKKVMKVSDGREEVDDRYICVSCEHIDYTPKTLEELGIKKLNSNKMENWLLNWTSWITMNTHAEFEGLTYNDGPDWFKKMWQLWLENSDYGGKIQSQMKKDTSFLKIKES
jgi:calcineurin-like phosphoesterase family protein